MINLFKKEREPENIKDVLKQFDELKKKCAELSKNIEKIKEENRMFIKKVEMVRYNPFSNAGGNQSFSIAMLNSKNDGIIITSLYAQDGNRVYGKTVENGDSKYLLSEEEKQAIKKAQLNEK